VPGRRGAVKCEPRPCQSFSFWARKAHCGDGHFAGRARVLVQGRTVARYARTRAREGARAQRAQPPYSVMSTSFMMPAPDPVCGLRKHLGGKDNYVADRSRERPTVTVSARD
jgi:hypothetical protein